MVCIKAGQVVLVFMRFSMNLLIRASKPVASMRHLQLRPRSRLLS